MQGHVSCIEQQRVKGFNLPLDLFDLKVRSITQKQWDYIIVGGGSAGCVLANRLSANPKTQVLLLDAGVTNRSLSLKIPAGMMSAIASDKFNWKYPSVPDYSRSGQSDTWSAGKAIGGGSAINGMFYIRGHRSDYDRWAQSGCKGWDYASVLPYFKSLETFEKGKETHRGKTGPQTVTTAAHKIPLVDKVVEAAVTCGHTFNEDYNGQHQTGVGYAQGTQKAGRRYSSADAFLKPAIKRKNLTVLLGAQVKRVILENIHATGVVYRRKGKDHSAHCRNEVILSAGAFGSPKLLMYSGIGPAEMLKEFGINVVLDAPQVGRNLMEHPAVYLRAKTKLPSLNAASHPLRLPFVLANWLFRGKGAASSAAAAAQVLCRSREDLIAPDIQLLLTPAIFSFDAVKNKANVMRESGMSMAVLILQPESRGRIILNSNDPLAPPLIKHELLGKDADIDNLIMALRKAVDIFSASGLSNIIESVDPNLTPNSPQQAYLDYVRQAAFKGDHACGTCRMGNDKDAVLDPELRVRGMAGLRVVDASVMPIIPSGNTNAPTLMIAEKASAMITGA